MLQAQPCQAEPHRIELEGLILAQERPQVLVFQAQAMLELAYQGVQAWVCWAQVCLLQD